MSRRKKEKKGSTLLEVLSWVPELLILPFRALLFVGRKVTRLISEL